MFLVSVQERKLKQHFLDPAAILVGMCGFWTGAQISVAPILFSSILYADSKNIIVSVLFHTKKTVRPWQILNAFTMHLMFLPSFHIYQKSARTVFFL